MKMRILKFVGRWRLWGVTAVILGLSCSTAFGALEVSLGTITGLSNADLISDLKSDSPNYYIDCYHYNPFGQDPRQTNNRLMIAKNDAVAEANPGLISDTQVDYAKYLGYVTSDDRIWFLRSPEDSSPGGTVFIRVWKGTPNAQFSYYSAAQSFPNGALSAVYRTLSANPDYKADVPYKPYVSKIEETSSTTFPDEVKSATVKVYSAQPAATDGKREVNSYLWSVEPTPSGNPNLTSSALELSADQVVPGETYTFRVSHKNWFSNEENWSDPRAYTIGSGAGPVVQEQLTLVLKKKTDDFGINTFSMPFGVVYGPNGNQISSVRQLVDSFNAVDSGYVSLFALWDVDTQQEIAFTFDKDGGVIDKINTGEEPSGITLQRGRGYQLSVTEDKTVTLRNYQ